MSATQLHAVDSALKVIPDFYKYENIQSQLKSIGASVETEFKNDTWLFPNSSYFTSLDFGWLREFQPFILDEVRTFADGTVFNLDFVTLIKILYLNEAVTVGSDGSRQLVYRLLLITCHFLSSTGLSKINLAEDDSLQGYLTHQLLYRVDRVKRVINRGYTPLNYGHISLGWLSHRLGLQSTLNELELSNCIWGNSRVSGAKVDKILTKILKVTSDNEISLSDYKAGESFNYLTLDYGRYYVDHCASYFKDNYVKAMALKETSLKLGTFGSKVGLSGKYKKARIKESHILSCTPYDKSRPLAIELCQGAGGVSQLLARVKRDELKKEILATYETYYRFHYAEVTVVNPKSIQKMAEKLGLINALQTNDVREHIIDRLKVIVQSTTSTGTCNHTRLLLRTSDFKVLYDDFNDELKSLKAELEKECIVSYFALADLDEKLYTNQNSFVYLQYIYTTYSAGFVHAMGLLGWRQSEFGFPLSSIDISVNDDKLDQYFHPLRYKVIWTAKKTAKETLLDREITQDAYHLIRQMNKLMGAERDSPCLLGRMFHPTSKKGECSNKVIQNQTRHLWKHFVHEYKPFKQDDNREEYKRLIRSLATGTVLSFEGQKKYKRLAEVFSLEAEDGEFFDVNLTEVKNRLRNELDRVMLAWKLDYDLLRKYASGDLPSNEAALIKEHIPQEVLETVSATSVANRDITVTVNNALKSNCIFPTPHAFRHMWAEAVYRRFDGDAGWMIRSHFKHISQSMWLAYIRNKDNQVVHAQAKRDVISTILTNFAKRGGDGYSGKVIQFINRGLKNTHMLRADGSIDSDIIDDFALSQIADIKSSPWGYCLLQRLDQDKANCAIDGVPQRFNASPKFCLGCNNFFTHATNVEGILMSIAGDVKALYAPIPIVFKETSKATVSDAYTHLKRLNASEEILDGIAAALNAVAAKEEILC